VKQLIKYILNEELSSKEYSDKEAPLLTNQLTNILLQKLKGIAVYILQSNRILIVVILGLNLEKYKFMVYIFLAEQRGQGLK